MTSSSPRPRNDSGEGTAGTGKYSQIQVRVTASTGFGESIRISGRSRALGAFNPDEAIELITTPAEYPVWRTARPLVVLSNVSHPYRVALFSGGEFVAWDVSEQERSVFPSTPTHTHTHSTRTRPPDLVAAPSPSIPRLDH